MEHQSSKLASALRILGILDLAIGIVVAFYGLSNDFVTAILGILGGGMGWLFCFAFATCVEAAHEYLNRR